MIWEVSIWSVALAGLISGVAICACRYIRRSGDRIRAPLRQQLEEHQEMLQEIQSAKVARDLFLASLSHELRTPLSGIQGAVQLLYNSGLKGPQHEYVSMISYASTTVLEIVDDMLTYSRMQAGDIQLESVSFCVRKMIGDMLALQGIKARDRGIVLISDISADVPVYLQGDRGKLNQVLLNLIGNAIKFTEEGSVTVSVGVVSDVNMERPDIRLQFMIRDTGIGLSSQELSKVFEPFAQGRSARLNGRQGTGLGLTISRRLVRVMGGDIRIESVPQEGTCVSFQLTLRQVYTLAEHEQKNDVSSPKRSLVVLVVEDDDINRLVCTRYLALAGHHPVAVADERQVQHVMSFSGRVPDVVLMDVNLAGYSGIDLVAKMRALEGGLWEHVPVIAMSADNSGTAQRQARAGGVAVFLAKPFSAEQLYEALESVVPTPALRHPAPDVEAMPLQLLDVGWLTQETRTLGVDVMFELLNLFRSSAAKTLKAMADAAQRQDWRAVADLLHGLQGSSSNLGMYQLVEQTRALRANVLVEGGPHPAYVETHITRLEALCHASADSVRDELLGVRSQGVAFTTQGDD